MIKILLLFFTLLSLLSSTPLKQITINQQDFYITTESYDIYDSKGRVMKLYQERPTQDMKPLLSLTLEDTTGSCVNVRILNSTYEVNGSSITFYSLWDRRGDVYNAPYGARIQQYKVLKNHTISLISSKIYIETDIKNADLDSGMQYLFDTPKTEAEEALFQEYISEVSKLYKGEFVLGNEAKKLIRDVKEALQRKFQNSWK